MDGRGMTAANGTILVLGTADWNQAIATNQHYIVRELAREFPIIYTESMGLRTPELKMRDIKRMARRIGIGSPPDAVSPRAVPAGVEIRSPKVLPKHTGVAHRFNQPRVHDLVADWIAQPGPRVLWTYTPVTYGLEELATAVVYHCVDLLREGPGIDADLIDSSESRLAEIGAHAIGTSPAVVENLKVRGFTDVEYWPNVADTAVIEAARPAAIDRVSKRVVFAGNLIPAKVDFDLLHAVIDAGYDLHLAGPVADGAGNARRLVDDLVAAGATYHGTLTLPQLAALYWTCEVGLIPYTLNKLTRGVSPLKTYEYLAAGLGVLSTPVPSVQEIPEHVHVRSPPDFLGGFDTLAPVGDAARVTLAQANSWTGRGDAARDLAATVSASEPQSTNGNSSPREQLSGARTMPRVPTVHLVVTRFNVGLDATSVSGHEWLRSRLELFRRFTLPTVASQTVQCHRWLIFCDDSAGSPEWFRTALQSLLDERASFARLIFVPAFDLAHITPEVERELPPGCRLLTTRIDNDDAIAADYFESIRRNDRGRREFINFPNGAQHAAGRFYKRPDPYNPFISLAEDYEPGKAPETVWSVRHDRAFEVADVRQVRSKTMWIANIHGGNLAQDIMGLRWPANALAHRFEAEFEPSTQGQFAAAIDGLRTWVYIATRVLASPARWRRIAAVIVGRRRAPASER